VLEPFEVISLKEVIAVLLVLLFAPLADIAAISGPNPKNIRAVKETPSPKISIEPSNVIYSLIRSDLYIGERRNRFRALQGSLPPVNGTWIINQSIVLENETIILNGSIIIVENGSLMLKNSTLYFNVTYNGEYNITIEAGGNLTAISSRLGSYDGTNKFCIFAKNGSALRLVDTNISDVGFDIYNPGILVETQNVFSINVRITNSYIGYFISDTENISIVGGYLDCSYAGIYINGSSNISMDNIFIDVSLNTYGVYIIYSSNITLMDSNMTTNGYAGIDIRNSSNIIIHGCRLYGGARSKQISIINSTDVYIATNSFLAKIVNRYGTVYQYSVYVENSTRIHIHDNEFVGFIRHYDLSPSGNVARLYQYCVYITKSRILEIKNNYILANITNDFDLPFFNYDFIVYQYCIYITESINSEIQINKFSEYVNVHGAAVAPPFGSPPKLRINYYGIYTNTLNNSFIHNNKYFYSCLQPHGFTLTRTYILFYSSHSIRLQSCEFINATTYLQPVTLKYCSNVSIYNLSIDNTPYIYLYRCDNTTINITTIARSDTAIKISYSSNIRILNSYLYDCRVAISIISSNDTSIINIRISNCRYAIHVSQSLGVYLINTRIYDSGFRILDAESFNSTEAINSLYNDEPLVILDVSTNISLSGGTYGALLVGFSGGTITNVISKYIYIYRCSNLTLKSITVRSNAIGIHLELSDSIELLDLLLEDLGTALMMNYSSNVYVYGIDLSGCNVGISIYSSSVVTIIDTWIYDTIAGIRINGTDVRNISILDSNIYGCSYGLYLLNASSIIVGNSTFSECSFGIYISPKSPNATISLAIENNRFVSNTIAIYIGTAGSIIIHNNVIYDNDVGLYVDSSENTYNLNITFNNFTDNIRSLIIYGSGVIVYGNVFMSNINPNIVYVEPGQVVSFNFSYFGNYWSNAIVDDLDMDGISDTPYLVTGNYYDYYPIALRPIIIFDEGLLCGVENYSFINTDHIVVVFISFGGAVNYTLNQSSILLSTYPYVYYVNVSDIGQGFCVLSIEIYDNSTYRFILYFTVDVSAPTINIDMLNGTWLNQSGVISITIEDSNPCETYIYANETIVLISNESTILVNVSELNIDDGYYNITIMTIDAANNTATVTVLCYIDTTAPQLLVSILNSSYTATNEIGIEMSDNMGLYLLNIYINGTLAANITLSGQESAYLLNISSLDDGIYEIELTLLDRAGNQYLVRYVFILDRTPPIIQQVVYKENVSIADGYVYIVIEAEDNFEVRSVIVEFTYNNTIYNVTAVGMDTDKYYVVIPITGLGIIEFKIIAIDACGNTIESPLYSINIYSTTQTHITTTTQITTQLKEISTITYALLIIVILASTITVVVYIRSQALKKKITQMEAAE